MTTNVSGKQPMCLFINERTSLKEVWEYTIYKELWKPKPFWNAFNNCFKVSHTSWNLNLLDQEKNDIKIRAKTENVLFDKNSCVENPANIFFYFCFLTIQEHHSSPTLKKLLINPSMEIKTLMDNYYHKISGTAWKFSDFKHVSFTIICYTLLL